MEFGADTYAVAEGGAQSVTVTLSADPERTVTIPLSKTEQGGATSADYSGVPVSVTFNAGETSRQFTFNATDDTVDDDGESVRLEFGTLPDRVSAGTRDQITFNITDNDDPEVTVEFGADTYAVAEGSTQSVRVTLSADPERTVIIPIVATGQGGAGADGVQSCELSCFPCCCISLTTSVTIIIRNPTASGSVIADRKDQNPLISVAA